MRIGVPTEIKNNEFRVAITPDGVTQLVKNGHEIFIQAGAGLGSSISNEEFQVSGATMVNTADEIWSTNELILKVKEPIAAEFHRMRPNQILFTYLHLAAGRECAQALVDSGITAIAYETVLNSDGTTPLLAPMSEVAGRLAPQVGADALLRPKGGRGVLLGGVSGTRKGRVVVLGGGVAGFNSAQIAHGMDADVIIFDRNSDRLKYLKDYFKGEVETSLADSASIESAVIEADLVIGAVLIPGTKTPKLVSNATVARMKPGSVLVDISIDQGGCFEDSKPTTHADPTYKVHSSIFYCVANMPGAVPHTSTYALTNATLPYISSIANNGWREALTRDSGFKPGLNVHKGAVVYKPVADALNMPYVDAWAI